MKNRLTALRNFLDLNSSKYENFLILGDLNVKIEQVNIFCENYNLKV